MRIRRWLVVMALGLTLPLLTWAQAPSTHVCRDAEGKICRSREAVRTFQRLTGHPRGWPGHVVDHIIALACGGKDSVTNMQWQSTYWARRKDRWETRDCHRDTVYARTHHSPVPAVGTRIP